MLLPCTELKNVSNNNGNFLFVYKRYGILLMLLPIFSDLFSLDIRTACGMSVILLFKIIYDDSKTLEVNKLFLNVS